MVSEFLKEKELLQNVFFEQQKNQFTIGNTTCKARIEKLKRLKSEILARKIEIRNSIFNDFRKPIAEVDLTEIYVLTSEIDYVIKNLNSWMKPKVVDTPIAMFGSKSWIKYEPKGTCLIISPWNFPFQLALGPLILAVAAGNTVILKPSEHTPHTSAILKEIIQVVFKDDEVLTIEGGVEITTELLKLPFNHIFFTGSPQVGKIVMKAAAEHLTSVTLELGGKSPTIIDESANISIAAKRIAWGKFINNGQICLAPDYLLVHDSVKDEFIKKLKTYIVEFYGNDVEKSNSYARIVNGNHFNRLSLMIEDAVRLGGRIEIGGNVNENENHISPTVITGLDNTSKLMQEEIFGPILPIVTFKTIEEVLTFINEKERPLALYIYSKNKKNIKTIIDNTRAGGTCINNNVVHFSNHYLPFGGINNSGIGKSNGKYGFEAFSNARGILKQNLPSAVDMLMPPYTSLKQKLIDLTIKYL
jgi:aldehyde dehydrogenase (NAD+)